MRLSSRLLCCLILYARERPDKPAPAIMKLYLFEFDEMTSLICAVSAKLKTYKETESFLFKQLPMYQRVGAKAFKKDLKNIKSLSKITGDPHKSFKSIHLAGTNGKGSTSFFIASLLSDLGLKVGLYTSPHYKDYRERIKIDGAHVSKKFVRSFVNDLIEKGLFESEVKPSFFEITVAMAFSYFKSEKVDIAVIETGLGGRLDSTNIITPELSIITNIGFDHVQFLGNTLPKIAKEKAGIIKKNVPVIIGKRQKETTAVFKAKAKTKNAKLIYAPAQKINIDERLKNQFPSYQHQNMKTAYVAVRELGFELTPQVLKRAWSKGLKKWGFVGRYMKISKRPLVLFDSAHNKDGISTLMREIKKEKFENIHIVLAVVSDKDLSQVLPLLPQSGCYYFSEARIPRAMKKEKLKKMAEIYQLYGKTYKTVSTALKKAQTMSSQKDLILVTGSIFTVAEVL